MTDTTSTFCTGGRVMQGGFQTTLSSGSCIIFLFPGFILDTPAKYALGIALAFSFGVFNEVLLFLRRFVAAKIADKSPVWRLSLGLIYGVHMILAYWMMLLVMTYETLLFFAIVFGLIAGHIGFQFVPQGKNPATQPINGSTPCCGGSNI